MFGFNKTAQILRPQGTFPGGGDFRNDGYTEVVHAVKCTLQEAPAQQQYLPGGQLVQRTSRLWLPFGTDVQENDKVVIDGVSWMVEGVIDEAGRGHHLVCRVQRFT